MKILQTYILKELFRYFVLSFLLLTFILVVGNLVKFADLVLNKGVEIVIAGKMFLHLLPYLSTFTLPLSMLTSTLFVFGRLSADNEVIAMRSSGISLFKLTFPVVVCAFILSLGCVVLNNRFVPKAHYTYRSFLKEIGIKKPLSFLEAGTFIEGFGDYVLFIYEIDGNILRNIRIYQPQPDRPPRTILAREGEILSVPEENVLRLKLVDGTSDEPNPQNPQAFYKLNFKTYVMNLNLSDVFTKKRIFKKPKDMDFRELHQEIERYKSEKINPLPLETELHRRLSIAFASLAFVLVGLPLAIRAGRGEKSTGLAMSLGIAFVYWILLAVAEALSLRALLPPALALWFPSLLLIGIGIYLICTVLERTA